MFWNICRLLPIRTFVLQSFIYPLISFSLLVLSTISMSSSIFLFLFWFLYVSILCHLGFYNSDFVLSYSNNGFFNLSWIGRENILIADPEAAKQILVTNCHKYIRNEALKKILPIVGNGLFSSNGKDHSRQKKLIGPAFNVGNLKGMFRVFQAKAALLVKVGTVWLTFRVTNFS